MISVEIANIANGLGIHVPFATSGFLKLWDGVPPVEVAESGGGGNVQPQSGKAKRPFPKRAENLSPQTTSELTHSKLAVSNRPGRQSLPSYTFLPFFETCHDKGCHDKKS